MTDFITSRSDFLEILELPERYRPKQVCGTWKKLPDNWEARLEELFRKHSGKIPPVFFRADDIGAWGQGLHAMLRLFKHHGMPLALAVVPAWINSRRIEKICEKVDISDSLWGWHQHGWRHINWNKDGKKAEFCKSRSREQQWADIWKGHTKLVDLFGSNFVPVFTPPWNRLDLTTLDVLQHLGFRAVSMDGPFPRGAKKTVRLGNFRIMLDLHTRKVQYEAYAFDELLKDLDTVFAHKNPVGIMIHHHRMNINAFLFLHRFLELLKVYSKSPILSFREMLEDVRK